ncbi:Cardiolipin synthase [Hondaea fermentalgiana]|uniref:Cardiolipin synthase n=1 Tax=Hondaea fermentalgiana TaxID=2315210 RepID=A0A2R5GX82_9STRA|nr:Cardiolipin synthase [Hondaea fermentalgiana]|eukprot:GBG34939.1 Cardiolipin synthase [Hondaea fermentalgiana]
MLAAARAAWSRVASAGTTTRTAAGGAVAVRGETAVQKWGATPVVRDLVCGNRVSALHDGAEGFPALHEAIEAAREEVLFEMYWFESDKAGWGIARRLIDAAKRGVAVRVVYDGFGCMDADKGMFEEMRRNGCEVLEFNPIPPWQRKFRIDRIFRRDHRKMMVVDRSVAFTGGMNICDFWLPKEEGGDAWRDVIVRIEGPVVPAFAGIFERLVGPLREGNDDRGDASLDDEDAVGCSKTIRPTFLRALLGWRAANSGHFQEIRDELALSVDKGRDSMTRSLLKRLNALPDDTLMLFPVGVRQENTVNTASDAWWSAQGRLRVGLFQTAQTEAALEGAAASMTASAPASGPGLSERPPAGSLAGSLAASPANSSGDPKDAHFASYAGLRPRDLFFEQVQTRWQKLGSNVQIITNDALSERNTIRRGYLRALQNAKRQITIVNSYFLPCSSIRRELYRAADRGVDVRIVVPGEKTDLQSVRLATHAMYERMLSKGIQLYEYMPSVLHSKVCIIDGEVSTVGTYNLDYRSWYYNLEIVTVIHDKGFATDLLARIQHDIDHACIKVEHSTWLTRSWAKRLAESFFYTFRHHM